MGSNDRIMILNYINEAVSETCFKSKSFRVSKDKARRGKYQLKVLFLCLFSIMCIEVYAKEVMGKTTEENDMHFPEEYLENPVKYDSLLVNLFHYRETDVFDKQDRKDVIYLENGYADANIRDVENFFIRKEAYQVVKVEVVYTKYPFHKKDWITNYYDLLARRLEELFSIDSALNSNQTEWFLISQTECKTAYEAKNMFHGIALYLEPLSETTMELPPVTEQQTKGRDLPPLIENMGFITSEEKDPDQFKSKLNFGSTGTRKRQMDPKDMKCPTWR